MRLTFFLPRIRSTRWSDTKVKVERYTLHEFQTVRLSPRQERNLKLAPTPAGDDWRRLRWERRFRCLLTGHLKWLYEVGHMYPANACYRCHGELP